MAAAEHKMTVGRQRLDSMHRATKKAEVRCTENMHWEQLVKRRACKLHKANCRDAEDEKRAASLRIAPVTFFRR